jgi:hypothetical protein
MPDIYNPDVSELSVGDLLIPSARFLIPFLHSFFLCVALKMTMSLQEMPQIKPCKLANFT